MSNFAMVGSMSSTAGTGGSGYASARDLPSVREMLQQIRGLKALTLILGRKHRETIRETERRIDEMVLLVDRFYSVLGERNWIFHDDLNVERLSFLMAATCDAASAETQLIAGQYEDAEWLAFMVRRLTGLPAMRTRMDLICKAEADYNAGRYYSTVLVLIAVMDGFVNDLDPGNRQGLHAREASDLSAWDSVVGHHMGLAHAHTSFTRSFKGTKTEPVHELYRNGIVHGNLTNFDNVVVASKAWNRLFAVADWARATERERKPQEPKPSLREVLATVAGTGRQKKLLDAWQPSELKSGDDGFDSHPLFLTAVSLFTAWQRKQYGHMVAALPYPVQQSYGNSVPREIRLLYCDQPLGSWTIHRLNFVAACVSELEATLVVGGQERSANMRWLRGETDSADPAMEPDAGVWRLMQWGPETFLA